MALDYSEIAAMVTDLLANYRSTAIWQLSAPTRRYLRSRRFIRRRNRFRRRYAAFLVADGTHTEREARRAARGLWGP